MSTEEAVEPKRTFVERMLDGVERAGNKVPHPAVIFLILIGLVIVASQIFFMMGVKATYEVAVPPPIPGEETYVGGSIEPNVTYPPDATGEPDYHLEEQTTEVQSLLTADGVRFIFTSAVQNFTDFGVVGVILVAMVGVGVAEQSGLIAALIRKLVKVSPANTITFIIVFLGVLSSIASDAGYLVLIPLGAAAFASIKRHPHAGLAAAYAGVAAGFGVNILITPIDGIMTEVTNEAIHLVQPGLSIDLTANLYFGIVSTFLIAIVATVVTHRLVEPRLGVFEPESHEHDAGEMPIVETEEAVNEHESAGLRYALYGFLGVLVFLLLLTVPSSAPLRNPETGSVFGDSPFMDSLIFIIMLIFLVAGIGYGIGAKTMKGSAQVIDGITKTFAGLGGLIFLLLIIAQFIAYFNYSNMATIAAVKMADFLESVDIGALWLLIGFIFVTLILDVIIPGVIPKWAIFAPIFVPLFLRLGVAPQTVLAAYRVGDSPVNPITPLMVYLPLIVLVAQRYKRDTGVGTIVSLMLPYTVIIAVIWTLLFAAFYLLGLPLGPGAPVKLG